jgi:hypothetical protein
MRDMLSSEVLQVLRAVDGRYLQWEWDQRTLSDDYIYLERGEWPFGCRTQ